MIFSTFVKAPPRFMIDCQDCGTAAKPAAHSRSRSSCIFAVAALGAPPVTYGKAAIVGTDGAAEHGAALLHPRFGKPVRAAIGGGQALMPSNVKVGGIGAVIDLPLGHKDDPCSFDYIDTLSTAIPDAPRPDEIVVCVGISDGARIRARAGKAPS